MSMDADIFMDLWEGAVGIKEQGAREADLKMSEVATRLTDLDWGMGARYSTFSFRCYLYSWLDLPFPDVLEVNRFIASCYLFG